MKKILKFPELRQTYGYDCGASATMGILDYYGIDVREDEIIKLEKTNHAGTMIKNIKNTLRYFGLKYKEKKMNISDLKKYIDEKIPLMIVLQAWAGNKKVNWEKDWKDGHYVVVIGYDANKIYFKDPSSERIAYQTYAELKKRWHDTDVKNKRVNNWGIAIWRPKNSKKNLHPRISVDYRAKGEKKYSKEKIIHMD